MNFLPSSPRAPAAAAFVSPCGRWCVVALPLGFLVAFAEGSGWRDAGFRLFDSCADAVAFVAAL